MASQQRNPYHPSVVNHDVSIEATWVNRTEHEKESLLNFLETRHSTRCFNPVKPVPCRVIRRAIEVAGNSSSSQNNQPWNVVVLQGEHRDNLSKALLSAFDASDISAKQPDYKNRPDPLPERLKEQISLSRQGNYTDYLGYTKDDLVSRSRASRANYEFFNAPIHMIIWIYKETSSGTFLDIGSYLSTLLLSFHAQGLGAIPQFSVVSYAPLVKKVLGLPDDAVLVSGVSVGYPVDGYRQYAPRRMAVDTYTQWRGFEEEDIEKEKDSDQIPCKAA